MVSCLLCSSQNCKKIHDRIRYNLSMKPYRCDDCTHVFLYPQMTENEENEFYKKEYGDSYIEVENIGKYFESETPEAKIRVNRIKSMLKKTLDIVEIGSACGYFLNEIKSLVRSVTGVEPHNDCRNFANKKGLYTVSDMKELGIEFGAVFMFHVLEHVKNPKDFLENALSLLKKEGFLLIEVPNIEDILVSTYKIPLYLDFYYQPAHTHYFSKRAIEFLLNKIDNYRITYEIVPVQRYDLSNHLTWMLEGKPGGHGKFNNIFSNELNEKYASDLKRFFLCDTLNIIIRKN